MTLFRKQHILRWDSIMDPNQRTSANPIHVDPVAYSFRREKLQTYVGDTHGELATSLECLDFLSALDAELVEVSRRRSSDNVF